MLGESCLVLLRMSRQTVGVLAAVFAAPQLRCDLVTTGGFRKRGEVKRTCLDTQTYRYTHQTYTKPRP